jgi:hypothetical protein
MFVTIFITDIFQVSYDNQSSHGLIENTTNPRRIETVGTDL